MTQSHGPTCLFRHGRVYSPADPHATAILVESGRITWLGPDEDAPATGYDVVDLQGALVTPAFVDAHVHCTDTGLALRGLDLSAVRSPGEVLERVAAFAATLPVDAVLLGHGWDDSQWPDGQRRPPSAAELDRAAGGRAVYLAQASVHSAAVSSALMTAQARAAVGFDASGWLNQDAHHVVRAAAMGSISAAQRGDAQRTALAHAASLGIGAVHECGGPEISSEADFTGLVALAAAGGTPRVVGYWGELMGAARAKALGAAGAAGDLFADGALGSRTAHLREAYVDGPLPGTDSACGNGYLSAEQVAAHLVDCAGHDVQGGFHAIGDQAIATVLAGFAQAAQRVGQRRLRLGRHRVEHLEIIDRALIAGLVEYGIVASVQPAFDRLWGGLGSMYEQRLGAERSLASNPIGAMHGVGVSLAFGSDAPVTALDPWGTVKAAMRHHNPVHRIGVKAAFAAHTRGGWRAAGDDDEGVLLPGTAATFAVWDAPEVQGGLPRLLSGDPDGEGPDPAVPVCVRTVVDGETIFQR